MRHMKLGLVIAAVSMLASAASAGMVEVSATYRERIAVPPDAVLELKLLDTSLMDVAATVLAEERIGIDAVPVQAVLAYDEAEIREGHTYTVSGAIYQGDALIFRTTTAYPVLTRGAGDRADIVLERMSAPIIPASADGTAGGITGLAWAVVEIAGAAVEAQDPPTLTLDAENNFALYGGCNRFVGTAEIGEDGQFRLPENFAGTLMACPPEREQLERRVLEAFRSVTGYARNENGLALMDEAGETVMRLVERPE